MHQPERSARPRQASAALPLLAGALRRPLVPPRVVEPRRVGPQACGHGRDLAAGEFLHGLRLAAERAGLPFAAVPHRDQRPDAQHRPGGRCAGQVQAVRAHPHQGSLRCRRRTRPSPFTRACTAMAEYPKIRAEFAGSRWPDLRNAGTAYVDLAVQLPHARYTDGYETVWFYQRLSAACAKHGQSTAASGGTVTRPG